MVILAWSVLLFFCIAIGLLLFMPLVIHIDTAGDLYQLRWGCFRLRILLDMEQLGYRFTAPLVRKEGSFSRPDAQASPRSTGSVHARAPLLSTRRIPALVRSFHVRRFRWVCDTGDVLLNAGLFPVFSLLRYRGHDMRISFTGDERLLVVLDNNLYRLLKAVLFTSTNKTHKP